MIVGVLRLTFEVPAASLKEKRGIMRPIVERTRHRFNVAVAEVDGLDNPAAAVIGVAVVSNDARHADSQLQAILAAIEAMSGEAVLAGVETELLHP